MSTKPLTVALWDTNLTNAVAVTGAHITDGYDEDETPTSGEFNYELNLIGQWCQYLNDGDIGLHNVAIGGTLNVTGASTLSTAHVTGTELIDGVLTTSSTIAASAGLTAAVNQDITVSGTGKYKHGTRTLIIPALPGSQTASSPSTVASLTAQVSTQVLLIPIVAVVAGLSGQVIPVSGVRVVLDGALATTFVAKVYLIAPGFPGPSTLPIIIATSPASSGAATQSLTIPMPTASIVAAGGTNGAIQFVTVERTGGTGTANVYWAEIDYTQP